MNLMAVLKLSGGETFLIFVNMFLMFSIGVLLSDGYKEELSLVQEHWVIVVFLLILEILKLSTMSTNLSSSESHSDRSLLQF